MEEKTNEPVWNGNTATVLNSKGHFGSPQPPQQQTKKPRPQPQQQKH